MNFLITDLLGMSPVDQIQLGPKFKLGEEQRHAFVNVCKLLVTLYMCEWPCLCMRFCVIFQQVLTCDDVENKH